jgi:hypothetical protein
VTMPDPTVQLRGFAGQAPRERPILERRPGIYDCVITARPSGLSGRHAGSFIVEASWEGPRMDGMPRDDPRPGQSTDMALVPNLELARHIVEDAVDAFKQWPQTGHAPDLRLLARRRQQRVARP